MLQRYGLFLVLLFFICCSCEQKTTEANRSLPLFCKYLREHHHAPSTAALVHLLNSHYEAYQSKDESIRDYPYIGGLMALIAMDNDKKDFLPSIKELYEAGADINMTDETGITPLHFAALIGNRDAIEWLVDMGASIHRRTKTGASVVMYAAWGGHADIMKDFLEKIPDLNDKDNMGQGIHIYASFGGSIECLKYLQDKGLDITTPGDNGVTRA